MTDPLKAPVPASLSTGSWTKTSGSGPAIVWKVPSLPTKMPESKRLDRLEEGNVAAVVYRRAGIAAAEVLRLPVEGDVGRGEIMRRDALLAATAREETLIEAELLVELGVNATSLLLLIEVSNPKKLNWSAVVAMVVSFLPSPRKMASMCQFACPWHRVWPRTRPGPSRLSRG